MRITGSGMLCGLAAAWVMQSMGYGAVDWQWWAMLLVIVWAFCIGRRG